jgi:PhoH-like ATPase
MSVPDDKETIRQLERRNNELQEYNSVLEKQVDSLLKAIALYREELDKHKKRQDLVGASARTVIRFLDSLRSKGSLYEGVRLGKGKGILRVKGYDPNMSFPAELDLTVPDHQILAVALSEQTSNRKVIVVSNDINMRVVCDSIGMESEDCNPEKVVEYG